MHCLRNSYNENGIRNIKTILKKYKNVIIEKSDKGKSIAIIDKSDYLQKMRNILADSSKFTLNFP